MKSKKLEGPCTIAATRWCGETMDSGLGSKWFFSSIGGQSAFSLELDKAEITPLRY